MTTIIRYVLATLASVALVAGAASYRSSHEHQAGHQAASSTSSTAGPDLRPAPTSGPRAARVCQVEEGGEVIGYTDSVGMRPGFQRVACPGAVPIDAAAATVDGRTHVPDIACDHYYSRTAIQCVDGWTGVVWPASALTCQIEDHGIGGTIVAYAVGQVRLPGFPVVTCPNVAGAK